MGQTKRAIIAGTGAYLPEQVLTNEDLEQMVDTSDEWITTRTGMKERRVAAAHEAASDLGANAAEQAIANAGFTVEDIDLILVGTVTPDHLFPSTACRIQAKIGALNAGASDVSAACSGFVYALSLGQAYLGIGSAQRVLVIGTEVLTRFTDYEDRGSCILFGDGAGAAVLVPAPDDDRGVLYTHLGADGRGGDMMIIRAGGSREPTTHETVDKGRHQIELHGREVFKFAVTKMQWLIEDAAEHCGIQPGDIDLIVPHQVNIRIINSAAERAGISLERIFVNLDRVGNTSGASVPLALHEAHAQGRIKENDMVLLIGFGGGLTWASAMLRW